MSGTAIVQEIVNILVAGLTGLGTGIGQGVSNFIQSLAFVTNDGTTSMSPYFILVIVFAAVALAVGLTTKIFNWLESLGN